MREAAAQGRPELLEEWRKLTTSDHVYYMCTKFQSDGDVHEYFTPYESPHEAFVRFMSVLDDLARRLSAPPERKSGRPRRGSKTTKSGRGDVVKTPKSRAKPDGRKTRERRS